MNMGLSQQEITILAQTLLGEAGGEGLEGMQAVAHVIRNRMGSNRFPNSAIGVAKQPSQFSTWNAGDGGNNPGRYRPGSAGWDTAVQAINQVFNGNAQDITGGATHYWAPRGMPNGRDPYWASSETTNGRVRIGNQVFLPRNSGGGNSALNAIQSATNGPTVDNSANRLAYRPPQPQTRPQISAPTPMPPVQRGPQRRNQVGADSITTAPPGMYGPQLPPAQTASIAPPVPQMPTVQPAPIPRRNEMAAEQGFTPQAPELPPLTPMEQDFGRVFGPSGDGTPPQAPQLQPAPAPSSQAPTSPMPVIRAPQIGQPPPQPMPPPRRAPQQRPNIFNTPQTGGLAGRLGMIPMRRGEQATGRPDNAYFERLGQNLPNPQELVRRIGHAISNPQPTNNGPRKFNPQTGKWEVQ